VTMGIVGNSNLSASAIADVANYHRCFLTNLCDAVTDAQTAECGVDGNIRAQRATT